VKKFQADNGLKADGIVGQATYAALEMPNVRYTVTIKHVNKPVAEEILKQYPTATMAAEEG
jgi:peptidoglycan hydrolase-like protein with peptidoglycan-binding domain